jgi:hypothetical protein
MMYTLMFGVPSRNTVARIAIQDLLAGGGARPETGLILGQRPPGAGTSAVWAQTISWIRVPLGG